MPKVDNLLSRIEKLEQEHASKVGHTVELLTPDGVKTLSSDSADSPRKPDSLLQACSDAVLGVDSEGARIVLSAKAIRWPSGDSDHLVELMRMVMCGEENTSDRME
jgi:hypothetical protein